MKKLCGTFFCMLICMVIQVYAQRLPYGAIEGDNVTVAVHPGVELMIIVQVLAEKYPEPTASAYATDMKNYFKSFATHPAVTYIKSFSRPLYTDFVELGWCFDGFPQIELTEPATQRWFKHYGKDSVLNYLKLVRQFYADTKFWSFYQAHETAYRDWARDVHKKIKDSGSIEKLYGFYRLKKPLKLYIGIEPLNSWGAHAIPSFAEINPKYNHVVAYETGYFNDTATFRSQPIFTLGTETVYDLLWHEGSHILIEDLMIQYKNQIQDLSFLFNSQDEGMKRNQINNWEYCLNENIVRSVVACLKSQYKNYRAYEKEISRQDAIDFIYVNDIAPFILKEYQQQKKYTDFAAFFPVMLAYLGSKSTHIGGQGLPAQKAH